MTRDTRTKNDNGVSNFLIVSNLNVNHAKMYFSLYKILNIFTQIIHWYYCSCALFCIWVVYYLETSRHVGGNVPLKWIILNIIDFYKIYNMATKICSETVGGISNQVRKQQLKNSWNINRVGKRNLKINMCKSHGKSRVVRFNPGKNVMIRFMLYIH